MAAIISDSSKDSVLNVDATTNEMFNNTENAIHAMDNLFIFLIIGLVLATAISAFFIRSYPIYFVIFLLIDIVVLCIVPLISNVWEGISEDSSMATVASQFPTINYFMLELPFFIFLFSIIIGVILYAKFKT